MNLNDPSLYAVTPREMTTYPFAWQNVPRFIPPFQPYGMQPFYPMGQFNAPYGAPMYPSYGAQTFVPPLFHYGDNTPFHTQAGSFGLPIFSGYQGWQKPFWYLPARSSRSSCRVAPR